MECKRCIEDLTAYQDGELSAADAGLVQSHLEACPACADELRSLRKAAALVDLNTNELEPNRESWNLVKAQISSFQSSQSSWWRPLIKHWRIAAATVVAAAIFILGYNQYQRSQRSDLEKYIAQYIQEREAYKQAWAIPENIEADPHLRNLHTLNPFIDVRANSFSNPFRSEDR